MGTSRYRNKTLLKNAFVAVTVFNIFACFVAESFVPPLFSLMHGKISCKQRRKAAKHCSNERIKKIMVLWYRDYFNNRRLTILFSNYGINMNSDISVAFVAILPTSFSHCGVLCALVKPVSVTRN